MNVADTILNQLGGNKFIAMTNAKNMLRLNDGLKFTLPRGIIVIITLENDLYNVSFHKLVKLKLVDEGRYEGVQAEQLAETIERHTGLRTSL